MWLCTQVCQQQSTSTSMSTTTTTVMTAINTGNSNDGGNDNGTTMTYDNRAWDADASQAPGMFSFSFLFFTLLTNRLHVQNVNRNHDNPRYDTWLPPSQYQGWWTATTTQQAMPGPFLLMMSTFTFQMLGCTECENWQTCNRIEVNKKFYSRHMFVLLCYIPSKPFAS